MRKRLRHLPAGLAASGALLVVVAVVGWAVRGPAGAAGAAAGVLLVAASYTLSSVAIARADLVNPRLVLPVGLGMYVFKFSLLGVVLAVIANSGWAGLVPMGVAIIVAALGWTIAQSWWTWRARIPYVEIDKRG